MSAGSRARICGRILMKSRFTRHLFIGLFASSRLGGLLTILSSNELKPARILEEIEGQIFQPLQFGFLRS
jgi:hypothetical protein